MSIKKKVAGTVRQVPANGKLETLIAGSVDKAVVKQAVLSYSEGLVDFLSPKLLSKHPSFQKLGGIKSEVKDRLKQAEPLITDIILTIDERADMIRSAKYQELIAFESSLWRQAGDPEKLEHGVRTCVDAGVPREAVAGSEGHMGRSLAGDDELSFLPEEGRFFLSPSTFGKRMIHNSRNGGRTILEIFVEHTGCGRRGQMLANLKSGNNVAKLIHLVTNNLPALAPEFPHLKAHESLVLLQKIQEAWSTNTMSKDGGVWVGMLIKLAHRQAYKGLSPAFVPIIPVELYDKMNGNLLTGLDDLELLTHRTVLYEGGFTATAMQTLIDQDLIFSLKHEVEKNQAFFDQVLSVPKGQATFENLQNKWLDVKTSFVKVTEDLWKAYRSNQAKHAPLREVVDKFLFFSLRHIQPELDLIDKEADVDGISSDLMKRRLIHQLFRSLAYAWVLDTFKRGNPPGKHQEDHLATGDSAVLGVKRHLALGQGDMQPPTVSEMITGYSVLMHSLPGEEGVPVVVTMKHDTSQPDEKPLTTEETQRAMDDFKELLKLWPYVVVGDIIPVIMIRDKKHGGISRLALSPILAYGDTLKIKAQPGLLPDFVPASNSQGKVIMIPAEMVLEAGVAAKSDLKAFRKRVMSIADTFSGEAVQQQLKR